MTDEEMQVKKFRAGSLALLKCQLFNTRVWWEFLGLLDFFLCPVMNTRISVQLLDDWSFGGWFYDWHNRTCPELKEEVST